MSFLTGCAIGAVGALAYNATGWARARVSSITYRLPGDFQATYQGAVRPRWRWLWDTGLAGLALWRMWFRAALWLACCGVTPTPKIVTGALCRVLRRVADEAGAGR